MGGAAGSGAQEPASGPARRASPFWQQTRFLTIFPPYSSIGVALRTGGGGACARSAWCSTASSASKSKDPDPLARFAAIHPRHSSALSSGRNRRHSLKKFKALEIAWPLRFKVCTTSFAGTRGFHSQHPSNPELVRTQGVRSADGKKRCITKA